jgi:hypothetical protein
MADAASSAADAALLSSCRLRRQPVRTGGAIRGRLLKLYLRLARLPSLGPVELDADTERSFERAADDLLAGRTRELPERRLDFLRWLAASRGLVFHGSPLGDLSQLEPIRRSRDTTAWGDQQALYASTDPVWAIYFACLRRDDGFRGTRNGTLGEAGGPLYPRSYFFVHNRGSASPHRFGPGSLYVLPPELFAAAPPLAGAVDTAHLVSKEAVTPLARVDVTPADFPFAGRIGYYRDREPIFVTLLRG